VAVLSLGWCSWRNVPDLTRPRGHYGLAMTNAELTNAIIGALTALATLAAVVVAVVGIRRESQARQRAEARADAAEAARASDASEREARDRDAEQRHQAERIVAWAEWETVQPMMAGGDIGHWKLLLKNSSDLPAFEVTVMALTPDETWRHTASDPVLPPHSTRSVKADPGAGRQGHVTRPEVGLRFRDAAGRWWLRTPTGGLRIEDDD
jgi:hypothetical protein